MSSGRKNATRADGSAWQAHEARRQDQIARSREVWSAFRDRVRERGMAQLPEIIRKYSHVDLKQVSPGQYMGCCPFHAEKTASFSVSSKGYSCFGASCGAKGDVFTFLQERCGMNFREALETVASEVGEPLPDANTPRPPRRALPAPRHEDPAAAYLADPERLVPHGFRTVPRSLWVPQPGRFASIFRPGSPAEPGRNGEPDKPEEPGRVKRYRPEMVHEYRSPEGDLRQVILRLRFQDGRKIFLSLRAEPPLPDTPPQLVKEGVSWQVSTGGKGRTPVYGAERVREWMAAPEPRRILILEGEKCVDYGVRAVPDPSTLVLSASGGFNASILADWRELTDEMAKVGVKPDSMLVWPDNEPDKNFHDGSVVRVQEHYAKQIMSGFIRDLRESFGDPAAEAGVQFGRIVPPEGKEKGWDLADAVDEGWTRRDLEAYMASAVPVDLSHMGVSGAEPDPETVEESALTA